MAPTQAGPSVDDIRKEVNERGIEFFFAQFVDMYSRPSAKLIPAAHLDDLVNDGAGFAGFAAGEIGQVPADPDIAAMPDLRSFTPVPWEPTVARFACDITVEGEEWPYDPRTILRRVVESAREKGFDFRFGLELEYFLVEQMPDGSIRVEDDRDTLEKPCYDLLGLTRHYEFLTTVSKYVNELGWGNYANDHEDANGQFEQNFVFADALTSCDRGIFFRYMVHTLAEKLGEAEGRRIVATFMPKPFSHLTGNGAHFHMSLWDGDTNLFLDENDSRHGLGLSETAYQFIGGLTKHARAYSAITAPTVNSYKRLKLGFDGERRHLVSGLDLVRLQQPHADAPHPRSRAGSRTARSTAPATRIWLPRRSSPPAWTGSRTASTRVRPTRRTSTRSHSKSSRLRVSRASPGTCTRRRSSSRRTTCSARPWAVVATRTMWTTSSASSAKSGPGTTNRSRPGRSTSI